MYNKLKELQPKLRELGFETHTRTTEYVEDSIITGFELNTQSNLLYYLYLCEIQKWLRDIYDIQMFIEFAFSSNNYGVYIGDFGWIEDRQKEIVKFYTYEEALLEGIIKSLKLIK